ncbi:MAG TPA: DUF89 family protein [Planctomycetes bacterium]|nr:DUF89 family protein [Planctomycetota bacterium]
MKIYLDCIPCFVRQALDAARFVTDDAIIHEQVVKQVLRMASYMDIRESPPVIGQQIHRLIRELVGLYDPYRQVKNRFNNEALKLYSKMRNYIIESANPLETAVRLAIAGNIIDFGVSSTLEKSALENTIRECLAGEFSDIQLKAFRQAVNDAEQILYLADNAGEIIFDRLLIERLPVEKVTVVVKGEPVINDATMEDALVAGLPQIVEVIDNGSDGPGTILQSCSEAFRIRFENADLIIAKGQGNYETLSDIGKNIFFILKAKCPVIAEDLGCEVGEMILRKNECFNEIVDLIQEGE